MFGIVNIKTKQWEREPTQVRSFTPDGRLITFTRLFKRDRADHPDIIERIRICNLYDEQVEVRETPTLPLNTDTRYSGCAYDHAPVGSSRDEYLYLRQSIAHKHGHGRAFNPADLEDDEEIIAIQKKCVELRRDNK